MSDQSPDAPFATENDEAPALPPPEPFDEPSPPPATPDDAGLAVSDSSPSPVADPIGVVRPGDRNTLAEVVVHALDGTGDCYDGEYVELVKDRQDEAGLEPNGVVSGLTWAYLLGDVEPDVRSTEAQMLASLLGMQGRLTVDNEVLDAVEAATGERVVNQETWGFLIDDALNPMMEVDVSDDEDDFPAF